MPCPNGFKSENFFDHIRHVDLNGNLTYFCLFIEMVQGEVGNVRGRDGLN